MDFFFWATVALAGFGVLISARGFRAARCLEKQGKQSGGKNKKDHQNPHHLHVFLNRKLPRFSQAESEPEMSTEEHAVLMKALNPGWRIYYRDGQGQLVDEGIERMT